MAAPPPPPPAPKQLQMKALYDYDPGDVPNQISMHAGDIIEIKPPFDETADWVLGTLNGKEGYFPRTYAELVK